MKRILLAGLLAAVAASSAASATAGTTVETTPIGRLPFPERGFVVDLPSGATASPGTFRVTENGRRVSNVDVAALGTAGISYGTVLAIDTSLSMEGAPLRSALAAGRSFVRHRAAGQQVGLVAFDGRVRVLRRPGTDIGGVTRLLSRPPGVAYGTRIYDALDRSLALLARASLSTGSIVLLSDGTDVGSTASLDSVVAKAKAEHVRIFTVGLRSSSFAPAALRRLASETGGSFAVASSASELSAIYAALGQRLAGEYVVRYRSNAAPHSTVDVIVAVRGVGSATSQYAAPTPSGLPPFHRSLVSRFVLSSASLALLGLFVGGLVAVVILLLIRARQTRIVHRIEEFSGPKQEAAEASPEDDQVWHKAAVRRARAEGNGRLARLERRLEIARIEMSALRVVLLTAGATVLAMLVLGLIAPVFAIVGLLTPLGTKALISRRLRKVRDEFADQLPPNLQVLASGLRVGHSFSGALTVVVQNAHEPSKSELQRVLTDEQLGVPVEEGLRRVAARMKSRDLEQVALLAELQRTAGGNAAEVLDTVVETLRERADVRRLVKTLTAQGRMARWILSALPLAAGLALFAIQPTAIVPMFQTGIGQVALVVAALMVITGSLLIQKIVDIKV